MAIHPVSSEELVTFSGWGQDRNGKPVMNTDVVRADASAASTKPSAAAGSGASAAVALAAATSATGPNDAGACSS